MFLGVFGDTFQKHPKIIVYLGVVKAREKFHSYGFPLIKNCGANLIADKRAVFIHELGLEEKDKKKLLEEIVTKLFG